MRDILLSKRFITQSFSVHLTSKNMPNIFEYKILLMLLCQSRCSASFFESFQISWSNLKTISGWKNLKDLKSYCRDLPNSISGRRLSLSKDPDKPSSFTELPYLLSFSFDAELDCFTARLNPELFPYFVGLKNSFTPLHLNNILPLNSMSSIKFYAFIRRYRNRMPVLSLSHLYSVLGSNYSSYRDFKSWLLKPAIREISLKTDLSITLLDEIKLRELGAKRSSTKKIKLKVCTQDISRERVCSYSSRDDKRSKKIKNYSLILDKIRAFGGIIPDIYNLSEANNYASYNNEIIISVDGNHISVLKGNSLFPIPYFEKIALNNVYPELIS